jgi:hypothetical protein
VHGRHAHVRMEELPLAGHRRFFLLLYGVLPRLAGVGAGIGDATGDQEEHKDKTRLRYHGDQSLSCVYLNREH